MSSRDMSTAADRLAFVLAAPPVGPDTGLEIGSSREGRPIRTFRFGSGPRRVSLLAGAHADEPVGPRLLRRLCGYLEELSDDDPLLRNWEWWIVPHLNPDGEARNRSWQQGDPPTYRLSEYLRNARRELPGDDLEFGFPRREDDTGARPESRAVWEWWRSADGAFALHGSLHGTRFTAGPWFLVEAGWWERLDALRRGCEERVHQLGYVLHDVERHGEKGFVRLARGFTTRPDSRAMRDHFLGLDDPATAARFRPSSMEAVRALGGDPLTMVSEMPLFITPGVGEELGPPDPAAAEWQERIARWRLHLERGRSGAEVDAEAAAAGLVPMPVRDQMELQWTFVAAGLEAAG